jgi:hypothetical protein
MTTEFPNFAKAKVEVEEVDGQIVEKRLEFSLDGLDYIFVFSPPSEDPEGGPTLTYVGDNERGRLAPSTQADKRAWPIAAAKMGLPWNEQVYDS